MTVEAMSTGEPRHVAVPGIAPREPFVGNRGVRALAVATDPHGKSSTGRSGTGRTAAPVTMPSPCCRTGFPTRTWPRRAGTGTCLCAGPDGRDLATSVDALGAAFGAAFGVETLLPEGDVVRLRDRVEKAPT